MSRRQLSESFWLLALALVTLWAFSPFFEYLHWWGDEGVSLHAATRWAGGETPYRDFFSFLPPGSAGLAAVWMGLFGSTFEAVRALVLLLFLSLGVGTFVLARQAGARGPTSFAAAVAFVVGVQGPYSAYNHHWVSTAFALWAFVSWNHHRKSNLRSSLVLSAALVTLAATTTPHRGVLSALGLVGLELGFGPRGPLRVRSVLSGVAIVAVPVLSALLGSGALGPALSQVLGFTLSGYGNIQSLSYGVGAELRSRLHVVLPILVAIFALVSLPRLKSPAMASLVAAGVGVATIFPRPDVHHIEFSAPLMWPFVATRLQVLIRGLSRVAARRTGTTGVRLLTAALVVAAGLVVIEPAVRGHMRMRKRMRTLTVVELPRGTAGLSADASPEEVLRLREALEALSGPGFFYPYDPMLAFMLDRRHVGPLDVLTPGYTTREQYRASCEALLDGAAWVVHDRWFSRPARLRAIWPALADAAPNEKRAFERIMVETSTPVLDLERFELRRVTRSARSLSACREIEGV